MLGALLIGLPIGIIAALRRNTAWDYVPMGLSMIGISVPVFVVAPILILVFAVNLALASGGRMGQQLAVARNFAGAGAGRSVHRLRGAADARQHGRGAEQSLHFDGPRQGRATADW